MVSLLAPLRRGVRVAIRFPRRSLVFLLFSVLLILGFAADLAPPTSSRPPRRAGAFSPVPSSTAQASPPAEDEEARRDTASCILHRSHPLTQISELRERVKPLWPVPPAGIGYPGRSAEQVAELRSAAAGRAVASAAPPRPPSWATGLAAQPERAAAVKEAVRVAWSGYARYAMGSDELQPLSASGKSAYGGLGATVLDSLDTLWLCGLSAEYEQARHWALHNLSFDSPRAFEADGVTEQHVSLFETTIRGVGGLLGAGQLAGDAELVAQAARLAARLLPAFDSGAAVPHGWVQLAGGGVRRGRHAILSEFATLSLEFITLSRFTGDARFGEVAEAALAAALRAPGRPEGRLRGLLPTLLRTDDGAFDNARLSFGGAGDSAYEYLAKTWLLAAGDPAYNAYREAFDASADAMAAHLSRRSQRQRLLYVAEQTGQGVVEHRMEHLACFMSGTLVLAAADSSAGEERAGRYMAYGRALGETCWQLYAQSPSGLAPDWVRFPDTGAEWVAQEARFQLRPETVESLFYLWRATGEERYREQGWAIFQAIQKHCLVRDGGGAAVGYTGVLDASAEGGGARDDVQPSWFVAETLKYLYLLFEGEEKLNLTRWVFNTEAHPMRVGRLSASLLHGLPAEGAEGAWVAEAWREALREGVGKAPKRGRRR